MKRKLSRLLDRVEDILAGLGGLLIVFAMISVSLDVLSRYFFNKPIGWVFEITEYLLLYIPLMGAAWLLRLDGHVNIDLVVNHLPARSRAALRRATRLVGMVVCALVTYWGTLTTWANYRGGIKTSGIIVMPKFLILVVIPIGFFLLTMEFLRKLFQKQEAASTEEGQEMTGL